MKAALCEAGTLRLKRVPDFSEEVSIICFQRDTNSLGFPNYTGPTPDSSQGAV
jgi:hypothetical protein